MATQLDKERAPVQGKSGPPWRFIILGCAVLAVAALIFSSAGPDRSRTIELKDASPYSVNPRNATTQKLEPNVDMPTAPRSR